MPVKIAKHCRVYPESSDGARILVMRYWPRGCRSDLFDCWMKHLAPSKGLLKWVWDQEKAETPLTPEIISEIWRERYRQEMAGEYEAIAELRRRHESGETITLLCSCHNSAECHRLELANLITGS